MGKQNNKNKKSKKRTTASGAKSNLLICLGALICFVAGLLCGVLANVYMLKGEFTYEIPAAQEPSADVSAGDGYSVNTISEYELSIHFLELGNKYTGDCTLVKVGDTEVLIDAGSKTNSVPTIQKYINQYCTDGVLEYVIVTHAHEDHYAGFATPAATDSIFDLYECKTIITFSQVTSGKENQNMYKNFRRELNDEIANGAIHYTAEQAAKEKFDLGKGVELEILDSYYYYHVSTTENNHSVCAMINQGTGMDAKHYLFTGDLEKEGEEELIKMNTLPQVELYKAGHHGSKTSSNDALLKVIQPKTVCVCCCAGSPEYTKKTENQFPTQDFIDRIAKYTASVYVTSLCVDYEKGEFSSMNGNIAVCANAKDSSATVYCSDNTTVLKDTEWFKKNRKKPQNWE